MSDDIAATRDVTVEEMAESFHRRMVSAEARVNELGVHLARIILYQQAPALRGAAFADWCQDRRRAFEEAGRALDRTDWNTNPAEGANPNNE